MTTEARHAEANSTVGVAGAIHIRDGAQGMVDASDHLGAAAAQLLGSVLVLILFEPRSGILREPVPKRPVLLHASDEIDECVFWSQAWVFAE